MNNRLRSLLPRFHQLTSKKLADGKLKPGEAKELAAIENAFDRAEKKYSSSMSKK